MDGNLMQAKINRGFGIAASKLGVPYQVARPLSTSQPLANVVATLSCAFNAEDWTFIRPNKYGKPTWYGVFDATNVQVGDYLLGPQGPFFVAALQLTLSQLVVACNRTVVLTRAISTSGNLGVLGYSGESMDAAKSTDILGTRDAVGALSTGWPASIVLGRKQHKVDSGLPAGGYDQMGFEVLLPASVPVALQPGDLLIDDLGSRYLISGVENSDLGWRCAAQQVHL